MAPATDTIPKPLLPVNGRPFVHYQLDWLESQGVTEIVYSIGYLGRQIVREVGDRVRYQDEQDRALGTGGAVRYAATKFDGSFFVLYGDSLLDVNLEDVWRRYQLASTHALMVVYGERGNCNVVRDKVWCYDKQATDLSHIDAGISIVHRAPVLGILPPGPSDLEALFRPLAYFGQLGAYETVRPYHEIGSPEGLARLEESLRG